MSPDNPGARRVKVVEPGRPYGSGASYGVTAERVLEDYEFSAPETRGVRARERARHSGAEVRVYDETGWLLR